MNNSKKPSSSSSLYLNQAAGRIPNTASNINGPIHGGLPLSGPGAHNSTNYPMMSSNPTIPQSALMALNSILTIAPYKHRKDLTRESVLSKYTIIGYIAAGTYGKVYKAKTRSTGKMNEMNDEDKDKKEFKTLSTAPAKSDSSLNTDVTNIMNPKTDELAKSEDQPMALFAIKKFKSDNHQSKNQHSNHDINGNDVVHYTGISQSAIREMSICRELNHKNITKLIDIILENKSIYMIFEFFEHDLLQIIHYHNHPEIKPIPESTIKSLIWQVLNGVTFLHKNWIFHRDLKPANIMVSRNGVLKIGDLGLARKFNNPLQSLYTGDKVVVTIWYRAPELLLGARNYTPSIDLWAVGCILAELISLRPIFKGEEAKMDLNNKKSIPFQKNQLQKIVEILGTPTTNSWKNLNKLPEFLLFQQYFLNNGSNNGPGANIYPPNLDNWYKAVGGKNKQCLNLLKSLLEYDPLVRLTADDGLIHPYFLELPKVNENAFEGLLIKYPNRRIYTDDNDIVATAGQKSMLQAGQGPGQGGQALQLNSQGQGLATKRHGYDEGVGRKRQR